jgi:hypothetical protein
MVPGGRLTKAGALAMMVTHLRLELFRYKLSSHILNKRPDDTFIKDVTE